ncbi:MAG: ankyrin repeat domain-containing protein [Syntrophales bacterium]
MQHRLLNAVWENDVDGIKAILDEMPELISARDENGRSIISWAVQQSDVNIIKLLIEKGADLNSFDELNKETPLGVAIWQDNAEIANYLIDNGADLKICDIDVPAFLHNLASKKALCFWGNGWDLIVDKILEQGVKFDRVAIAAALGSLKDVEKLVDSGCDVDDFLDNNYRTALHIATLMNNKEMVKYLLSKTKHINWEDYEMKTAIDIAVDEEIISLLREAGAESHDEIMDSINQSQSEVGRFQEGVYYGETLLKASQDGDYDKVREIIALPVEKGGFLLLRLLTCNKEGKSALHLAAENGHVAIVEYLLSQGMMMNVEDLSGETHTTIKELIKKYESK